MRTCCVVLPLERLELGDVVVRAAWPAHVTLVGDAVLADGATDAAAAMQEGYALPARQEQDVALLRRLAERRPAR